MTRCALVMSALLFPLLVMATGDCARGEEPAPTEMQVLSVELQPGEASRIPLVQDRVVLLQPDGKLLEIPVVLEKIQCQFTVRRLIEGEVREGTSSMIVYELRSADPKVEYSWAFVDCGPVAGLRLFSNGRGSNYLAWVRGFAVRIAEVSRPRDRQLAATQFFAPQESAQTVDALLHGLVPGGDLGVDAFRALVEIRSVGKSETGDWVIEIASEVTGKHYTIVGDGKNWHTE